MAERVYLEWTIENWITVGLMVVAGWAVVALISSAIRHYSGSAQIASTTTGT
jgi:hypothetical protein